METKNNQAQKGDSSNHGAYDELEAMFGKAPSELELAEQVVLSSDLEGFAHCFPDWDLHPPARR